jgi:glutathione peroxidase
MGLAGFLYSKVSSRKRMPLANSVYEFKLKSLTGDSVDFAGYKGKKLLLVNTASRCGKTPQYEGLQQLHERYGDKVTVLGFPANNFLWQEPGTNQAIAEFCERNYGVTFQMFEKLSVKGKDQHPLYAWLEAKTGQRPDWNFAKYLVSEDGQTVTFFKSGVEPLDQALLSRITE